MAEVPMTAENVPEIDILLISHDHYDDLDYQTIKEIDEKVKNYLLCAPWSEEPSYTMGCGSGKDSHNDLMGGHGN